MCECVVRASAQCECVRALRLGEMTVLGHARLEQARLEQAHGRQRQSRFGSPRLLRSGCCFTMCTTVFVSRSQTRGWVGGWSERESDSSRNQRRRQMRGKNGAQAPGEALPPSSPNGWWYIGGSPNRAQTIHSPRNPSFYTNASKHVAFLYVHPYLVCVLVVPHP